MGCTVQHRAASHLLLGNPTRMSPRFYRPLTLGGGADGMAAAAA